MHITQVQVRILFLTHLHYSISKAVTHFKKFESYILRNSSQESGAILLNLLILKYGTHLVSWLGYKATLSIAYS